MRQSKKHRRPGPRALLCFGFLLTTAFSAGLPAVAGAATITDRPLLFGFDGAGTTAGPLVKPNKIAVDNSSGTVYVSEGSEGPQWATNNAVSKFGPDGTAVNFGATGTSSLFGPPESSFGAMVGVAVDNSGGPNQGRLYVADRQRNRLIAFAPDGTFLWEVELGTRAYDVAVDVSGNPWVLTDSGGEGSVREYASTGSSAPLESFPVTGSGGLDIDVTGNVYVASETGVRKYVGGAFQSILDPGVSSDVYADQSSPGGHVFVEHGIFVGTDEFNEYDAGGALVSTFADNRAIDAAAGIAYSPSPERVYVANDGVNLVEAFGSPATGTVPDPAIEATVTSGPGTVTFHGTINPQGVANAYYFEWADNTFNNFFGRFFRSPLQTLPADGSPHAVEYKATNVEGTLNWNVRLVAVNTADGLRSVSGVDAFQPPKAGANPVVSIGTPIVTTEGRAIRAQIGATVNPKLDSTVWRVQYTEDPGCSLEPGLGQAGKNEYLPGGEVNTAQNVSYDLRGLKPSQHYCVRIQANNSFDLFGAGSTSEFKEFITPALPPDEVSTAFAAPRTDTSARINGRVNPEGSADFEYQFEWSEDGFSWHALEPRKSTIDSSDPVIVADRLIDLKPDTTYRYRLAFAKNETGQSDNEAGPGGVADEATFATRSPAEMTLPQRGDELVNNPDTGNQNVFMQLGRQVPYMSADGDRAIWAVTGGAPGSFSGVFAQFLAERTPGGWVSRNLIPPAAEQFGGGRLRYGLTAASAGFTRFLTRVKNPSYAVSEETLARLDDHGHQDVLGTFGWGEGEEGLGGMEMSSEGAHALTVDPETRQLVDVGSGSPEAISLMPNGTPSECGLNTTIHPSFASATESQNDSNQWRMGYRMMASTDASLVYFRAKPNGDCAARLGLYVRDRKAGKTTLIAAGEGGHEVEFVRASADGHLAFFLTASPLRPDDQNIDVDLYRWNDDTGESTCLTCVVADARIIPGSGSLNPGGWVSSPVMISDDLSHVYFQSKKKLVAGEGVSGGENLYVLSGNTIRFVATIRPALNNYYAALSSDGDTLLFASEEPQGITADAVQCAESGCKQLYLYDDRDGSILCLTCAPAGVTAHGLPTSMSGGGFELSADGSTVAFTTFEGLVPGDVNHTVDAYEWHGGSLGLLSDGVSEAQANTPASPAVWGMSADGSDILFTVAEPGLTGFEQNGLGNLYDARIGGGFEAPSPPLHCSGESCQGPLVGAPEVSHPASSDFSGSGNLRAGKKSPRKPCGKARGRAKQRCQGKHKHHSRKPTAHRRRDTGDSR